jgi:hypothetical protein
MALIHPTGIKRLPTTEDLSAKEGIFVKLGTDGRVSAVTAVTDTAVGVVTRGDKDYADVYLIGAAKGTVQVLAGGALTAGTAFGFDAAGKALATAVRKIGIALQPGTAGELVEATLWRAADNDTISS